MKTRCLSIVFAFALALSSGCIAQEFASEGEDLGQDAGDTGDSGDTDPNGCEEGSVDLNDDPSDGCECQITDEDDRPDTDDRDENCDGIDGNLEHAVFVALDGDDDNSGVEPDEPLRTLGEALRVANRSEERQYLLVSEGTYDEVVELRDGISIYGGYRADDEWTRDLEEFETRIEPSEERFDSGEMHYRSVIADGLDEEIILDGLVIAGFDASSADTLGASSYGVWAHYTDGLSVTNSRIEAGAGADGDEGDDGVTDTCSAPGGEGGEADPSTEPCNVPEGTLADSGTAGEPDEGGGDGTVGGEHACEDSYDECGGKVDAQDAADGASGDPGDNGTMPSSSHGEVDGGLWLAPSGDEPTSGAHGAGGGGGGAGANCERDAICTISDCLRVGGDGGDGGDGGCAGTKGENGQSGGGSFGVFAVSSNVTLDALVIERGRAGDGGDGGDGGEPEEGEPGGRGNGDEATREPDRSGGKGGWGGWGGDGGAGGAGAGGCGGPSIGVASFASELSTGNIDFGEAPSPAEGGDGGEQPVTGEEASDGCQGEVEEEYSFD